MQNFLRFSKLFAACIMSVSWSWMFWLYVSTGLGGTHISRIMHTQKALWRLLISCNYKFLVAATFKGVFFKNVHLFFVHKFWLLQINCTTFVFFKYCRLPDHGSRIWNRLHRSLVRNHLQPKHKFYNLKKRENLLGFIRTILDC